MGIKLDEKKKTYCVQYQKRHPVTRIPVPMRRKGIKTLAEAKRVERELIIAVEEKLRAKIIPSWRKLVEGWEENARGRDLTAKTIENYRYSLDAYTSQWNERLCDRVTTQEIRTVIITDCSTKSDHQKQAVLKFIRCVFEFGVESGFLVKNPTPKIKFRNNQKVKKVLSAIQVELLLNKARELDSPWYTHWTTASYTGMRSGELYALTWDKVDFDNRTILVNTSWSKKDGFKCTKSGDDRIIPIAPKLLIVLKELRLGSNNQGFVLPRLGKWDKGEQARELRFFQRGLGIEDCRFHDLRATFATLMLQSGVAPVSVMKVGGWKNMKTMMEYVRMAGVDIKGITDNFDLHDPTRSGAQVLQLRSTIEGAL